MTYDLSSQLTGPHIQEFVSGTSWRHFYCQKADSANLFACLVYGFGK